METEDVLGCVSSVVRMTTGCGKDNFSWYVQTFIVLMCLFFVNSISFNALCKFLRLGNSAWDFFGVNVWSRDFFGFVGSPTKFFGF